MINLATRAISSEMVKAPSRALQLFDPPVDAVYSIEAAAKLTGGTAPDDSCLLQAPPSFAPDRRWSRSYSFDGDGIRSLRRIEALRAVCGDDFAGIKIILDLTKELEHLQMSPREAFRQNPSRKE